jgi:hypothetical protein
MTKKQTIQYLKQKIEEVEKDYNDNSKLSVTVNIKEYPKCSQCGTYQFEGYEISAGPLLSESCNKCGFEYFESF